MNHLQAFSRGGHLDLLTAFFSYSYRLMPASVNPQLGRTDFFPGQPTVIFSSKRC